MKEHLRSMTLEELSSVLKELNQPAFRAKQVFTWLHKGVTSCGEMTNLPQSLRDALDEKYPLLPPKVVRKQESQKDGTIKYLWMLSDGNCVETVLMRYHYGNTVCISTEVGCAMGCAFCASTLGGLVRRLEPREMLEQVMFTQIDSGLPISHIVLMGIGEPLDNYDNVLRFLHLVNSELGMNISMRHISLSTCGLVPKIDKLAEEKLQLTLSVSLHAPNDTIRNTIMPVNKAYPVDTLLDACRRYYQKTGRRISFEYAMIDGVNDTVEAAKELTGEKTVFLHYPPVYGEYVCEDILAVLAEYGITKVYHGHIHGSGFHNAVHEFGGISFQLISADCIDFTPILVV